MGPIIIKDELLEASMVHKYVIISDSFMYLSHGVMQMEGQMDTGLSDRV